MTDEFQPLDPWVFGAMKGEARRLYHEYDRALPDEDKIKVGRKMAAKWLRTAWRDVSPRTLEKAWDIYPTDIEKTWEPMEVAAAGLEGHVPEAELPVNKGFDSDAMMEETEAEQRADLVETDNA